MAIVVNPENVATAASADSHASQAHKNIPVQTIWHIPPTGLSVGLQMLMYQRQSNLFLHVICQFTHDNSLQKV